MYALASMPALWPFPDADAVPVLDDWEPVTGFEPPAELVDRAVQLADETGQSAVGVCVSVEGDSGTAVVLLASGGGPVTVEAARLVSYLAGVRLSCRPDWLHPRLLTEDEWLAALEDLRVAALERDVGPAEAAALPDEARDWLPPALAAAYAAAWRPAVDWDALPVAWVRHARDPALTLTRTPWHKLAARLQTAPRVNAPDLAAAKASCAGWMPIVLRDGAEARRRRDTVAAVWALVADLDDAGSLEVVEDAAQGLRHVWHTTISHTPEAPRARLVLPLARPVPAEEWPAVWAAGARWAGARGLSVDSACKDSSRLYYLPAVWTGGAALFHAGADVDAPALDPDALLRDYPEPRVAAWTYAAAESAAPAQVQAGRKERAAARALETMAGRVRGASQGQRRRVIFDAAFFVGRALVAPGHLALSTASGTLRSAASGHGLRDADRHVERGLAAGIAAAGA